MKKLEIPAIAAILIVQGMMTISARAAEATSPALSTREAPGRIEILARGQGIATYVYEDTAINRPYFCQIKTLEGVQVTRVHPPDPVINKGNDDHPLFHPGLWLAFGDINGSDYWRNKARVRHVRFLAPVEAAAEKVRFAVLNRYERADASGAPICEEACTYTIQAADAGYFLLARSVFRSDTADFSFGDQEEMGFGVRLNTPLTVKFGTGSLVNSAGGRNEKGTWGQASTWCAASGLADGKRVGVAVMPAPDNFRPAWFHTRDYGLIVANPFGRKAMTAPEDAQAAPDATVVRKGEPFTLAFGVYVFGGGADAQPDFARAYETCLDLFKAK